MQQVCVGCSAAGAGAEVKRGARRRAAAWCSPASRNWPYNIWLHRTCDFSARQTARCTCDMSEVRVLRVNLNERLIVIERRSAFEN